MRWKLCMGGGIEELLTMNFRIFSWMIAVFADVAVNLITYTAPTAVQRWMVMGMAEMIDKWEVVSKLITLQNNYTFFKNEWDAERLCREIAKLEIEVGKTRGLEVVRCKDCDCHRKDGVCVNPHCTKSWYGCLVPPSHFCSYGERREGE